MSRDPNLGLEGLLIGWLQVSKVQKFSETKRKRKRGRGGGRERERERVQKYIN